MSIATEQAVVPGNLEAIDQRRALVLTEVPLAEGLEISIQANAHVLTGVVEECRLENPLGWFIEVRLKPESWWSEQWFKPQHLFKVGGGTPKVITLEKPSVTEKFFRAHHASRVHISSAAASCVHPRPSAAH